MAPLTEILKMSVSRFWPKETADPARLIPDYQFRVQRLSNKFRKIEDYDFRILRVNCDFRIRRFLSERTKTGIVRWADVPCGVGVALYQGKDDYGEKLEAVGADLFRWDEKNLYEEDLEELEKQYDPDRLERLLRKETFQFVQDDMKKVMIPGGADLITALCGIYYHDDPLGVWENLYNQVRPGGAFVAHFMLPRYNLRLLQAYKNFTAALSEFADAEIYFSAPSGMIREAVLITQKTRPENLAVNATVKKIRPYQVSYGLHGKFEIKEVEYELGSESVTLAIQ